MSKKSDAEQERLLREKRELLKLKQGLIEESDVVEDYQISHDYKELHGVEKAENFWYHYKWHVIVITLVVIFVGFMVYQTATREKRDLYVLAISTTSESGIYLKSAEIEKVLERYCPDFDGNGYVHVGVNFINRASSVITDSDNYKFTAELYTGDSQLYLADSGIIDVITEIADGEIEFFVDFSEQYPDNNFCNGDGIQLNSTGFAEEARWQSCPDINGLFVRDEFDNITGDREDADEQRRRALIVVDNIINGNIVNPETAE